MNDTAMSDAEVIESLVVNSSFHRFPAEAGIIGRLLTGYGELEFLTALCLGRVLNDRDTALRAIFGHRGETARIELAATLMRPKFSEVGLQNEFGEALGALRFAVSVRNQYAHCHWGDHAGMGLYFTNLEDAARKANSFEYEWHLAPLQLLKSQEIYFSYARIWLFYLEQEYALRTKQIGFHIYKAPPHLARPLKCEPPVVPPWIAN